MIPAIILLLIFCSTPSLASPASSSRHWIFLQEDSNSLETQAEALQTLRDEWPERSLARRRKSGVDVSPADLPLPEAQIKSIEAMGARVICRSKWLRAVSVEAFDAAMSNIKLLPFVREIGPVGSLQTESISDEEGWSEIGREEMSALAETPAGAYGFSYRQAELAGALELHRRGLSGEGVLVGFLDSGFQLDHQAFAGLNLVAQYDFIHHDPDPSWDARTDKVGQANHGTACLSVVGGYEPGKLAGLAPRASFALGKSEETAWEREVEEDYWIEGIEWLEGLGADVVSSSLTYRDWYRASEYDGKSPISRAAQRAADLGIVICISAGNAGPGSITIGAPADAPGVLAVAAVDSSGRLTNFSARGPASDGRIKPDIAAMGRQVVCVSPLTFDRYARWNGTSLACPIAAGVAALILEAHPDWPGQRVVEALRATASNAWTPDDAYGYGLVDGMEAADYPSLTIKWMGEGPPPEGIRVVFPDGETVNAKFTNNLTRLANLSSEGVYELDNRKFLVPPSAEVIIYR